MKKILLVLLLAMAGSFAANAQCAANFNFSVNSNNPPGVQFLNNSFGDSTMPITYSWDFGDGSPFDTNVNPFHVYPATGVYNVCLSMADNSGCSDTICISVNAIPPPPVFNTWFITDSMSMFACIAPATVNYYYSVSAQGFSVNDTVFNVQILWGDGSDSTFSYTGVNAGIQGVFHHAYTNAGTYTAQLVVTGANGSVTSGSTGQQVIVASSCGSVSGHVYNDLNNNCVFDSGEELQNIAVTITNGTMFMGWAQTDNAGAYSFNVPTGSTYTVAIQANNGLFGLHTPSCPASGTLTVSTIPSTGNDFGVTCPAGADLAGTVSGWRFRPGTTTSVCVYAYNLRCSTPSGSIELTLSGNLTPLPDTAGIGYTVSGQTVTFPINSPALNWSFCFPVAVSASAQVGDTVCIDMNIIAPGDSVPSNNTGTFCFEVRNSFDPNDKYAAPAGDGNQNAILPNTPLTYTIRFQNTGNDVAYDVYIMDTLDANLEVTSLEVIGTSHPVTYAVLAGNILRFTFSNIMLADSNANEAASHGYITYRINQVSSVANGTQIHNSAAIFFDFNPPIFTNTTLHTIDYFLAVPVTPSGATSFSVYPNPAFENCSIRFSDSSPKKVSIIDALGKEVFHSTATSMVVINTSTFAEGIYSIHVVDGLHTETSKLMICHN